MGTPFQDRLGFHHESHFQPLWDQFRNDPTEVEPYPMPPIEHLVEAGIYAEDLEKAEVFYREVLGLDLLTKEPGRHVFFRAGSSVLLVFRAARNVERWVSPTARNSGARALRIGHSD